MSILPEDVARRAACVVADTVAVARLAGARPEVVAQAFWAGPGPSSTVLANHPGVAPDVAAAVNGTAAVWHELDEGLRGAGHPGAHVVAAAAAVAEAEGSSAGALLEAVALGYQAQAELGARYELHPEVHPHGTLGAPAAAAAVAHLLGLDAAHTGTAVAIAANLAPAGAWSACLEGSTVRNVQAGAGAHLGLRAAYLARAGTTAPRESVELAYGLVRGRARQGAAPADDWSIRTGYLKTWSACAWSHTALDVVDQVRRREPGGALDAARIHAVELRVPAVSMPLARVLLQPALAARFSIPALVATLLVHGRLRPEIDTLPPDGAVAALAARVRLTEDRAFTRRWPAELPAAARVVLADGTERTAELGDPVGARDTEGFVEAVRVKLAGLGEPVALLERLLDATRRNETISGMFASPNARAEGATHEKGTQEQ